MSHFLCSSRLQVDPENLASSHSPTSCFETSPSILALFCHNTGTKTTAARPQVAWGTTGNLQMYRISGQHVWLSVSLPGKSRFHPRGRSSLPHKCLNNTLLSKANCCSRSPGLELLLHLYLTSLLVVLLREKQQMKRHSENNPVKDYKRQVICFYWTIESSHLTKQSQIKWGEGLHGE